ncbi:Transcription initiation factor TFIID subunit 2 [Wickerhamiella sorbophila]|uniref:Transcription initiation factor TFIID subunit 2 n=1 Tax=Wickerhamiella sorbophila TaxID=45607 RepID=A0A2T0FNB5_9ASCO|nr:Transcription initiation factor TFIID subunit 2 [Wickerhamiella sorbophila]PRT56465.1 Transcription initiation factor TFIID subunit 2 [Wickerhamiella sorbophila]
MTEPSRGFRVAHQKVSVDVDLFRQRLIGHTELTIVPTTRELHQVRLDARQLVVQNVLINGKHATFAHNDLVASNPERLNSWIPEQHRMFYEHRKQLFQATVPGELLIDVPEDVSILDQDTSSTYIVSHASDEQNYQPLTVRVAFEVSGSNSGFNFVGGQNSSLPRSKWHAYTTSALLGASTSCWLPCVDGLWELSTWEIEVSVPKTLKDVDRRGLMTDNTKDEDNEEDEEGEHEILAVCNNNSPSQVVDPTASHKKIVSFELFNPVSAHHLGFAVGPFVQTPMTQSTDDLDESGTSSVPFSVFALRESVDMVKHCCGIFVKAMDFFNRDFGSFPYSSYSLCFVSDMPETTADAAGLTILSDGFLFPSNVIEPVFQNVEPLICALAAQWCGVSIVPKTWNDIWVTQGVAMYMTHLFVRKLMGNNEYRFRMRKYVDEITRQDINMPPLAGPDFQFPITNPDLGFIQLKAPLVLYILDRRMTKTDRSLGLSRVIPKLFLQSMSGDLHSTISTAHFIKLCERVAHHRLTKFFQEWVYGSGYPIFRVTQRFNKKRMFIEMGIGQVQSRELPPEALQNDTFLAQALRDLDKAPEGAKYKPSDVFTGPMTIRIHEADGTPYEHVVDLKEGFTKLDIQYNTKYKRLKRTQRYRNGNAHRDEFEDDGSGLIHCLGDVLMGDRETEEWKLSDWGQDDEEYMFNEAFEWIRVDSDFEWICKMSVGQPDYMYASQLQQDRDVVAQYEAVTFFSAQPPNAIHSSILLRTLMDRRYFYGIRILAAFGVATCAVSQLKYIGKYHLMRAFQVMYCFPGSLVPKANDFQDFANYFVQRSIPVALSTIQEDGRAPKDVAEFLLDLVRYNENSGNPYSDSYYVSTLITSIVNSLKPPKDTVVDYDDAALQDYVSRVTSEISKCQRLDRWLPSFKHVITTTALTQTEALIRDGYGKPKFSKLLSLSAPENPPEVRLAAFSSLLNLGGYRTPEILSYALVAAVKDPSMVVRTGTLRAVATAIGQVAVYGEYFSADDPAKPDSNDPLVDRQHRIARRAVHTAIPLLQETIAKHPHVAKSIWSTLRTPGLGVFEQKILFEVLRVAVEAKNSMVVTLKTPKLYKLAAKRKRDFLVVVKYRSVLRREKKTVVPRLTLPVIPSEPAKPPALKLKLGFSL